MPRQVGPIFIEGTFGDLIFYKLGKHYYVRQKPAKKKRKQMEADERYERTLQQADQFGLAVEVTKWVYYRHVVKAVRRHGLFGELTGLVNRQLQKGEGAEEVKEWLIQYCKELSAAGVAASTTTVTAVNTPAVTAQPVTEIPAQKTVCSQEGPVVGRGGAFQKQPRYVSRWKVNRKGRLQVPAQAGAGLGAEAADIDNYCQVTG